jgi:hypothetical protein
MALPIATHAAPSLPHKCPHPLIILSDLGSPSHRERYLVCCFLRLFSANPFPLARFYVAEICPFRTGLLSICWSSLVFIRERHHHESVSVEGLVHLRTAVLTSDCNVCLHRLSFSLSLKSGILYETVNFITKAQKSY